MRIYVCGPLSNPEFVEQARNITAAIDAGIALIKRGHEPFIPHLSYWTSMRAEELDQPIEYERWLEIDFAWLRVAEGLLFLGESPGSLRELELANILGLPVFKSLEEVPVAQSTPA